MGDPSVANSIDVSNLSIGERVFFFSFPTIVNLYGLRFNNVNSQPEIRESLLRFDNLNITTIQIDGINVHNSHLGSLNIIRNNFISLSEISMENLHFSNLTIDRESYLLEFLDLKVIEIKSAVLENVKVIDFQDDSSNILKIQTLDLNSDKDSFI